MKVRAFLPVLRRSAIAAGAYPTVPAAAASFRSYRGLAKAPAAVPVAAPLQKLSASPWHAGTAGNAARFLASPATDRGKKPTMEMAQAAARDFYEMTNDVLLIYAAQGVHEACRERLLREIMVVDKVSWEDAHPKLENMEGANKVGAFMFTLPYKVGITIAIGAGVASIPLVFDLNTALWFNEHYVTTDVAEPEDLETFLEVGSWTWSWMEPPLGQISFFLLTLQFARNQMLNLGAKPYTRRLQVYRANRLCGQFPMYSTQVVKEFVFSSDWS